MKAIKRGIYANRNVLKSIYQLFKRIGALYQFIKDPNVAIYKKIIVILGLLYIISPIDIIPEAILGFGFIDDAVLMLYMISKISDQLDQYIINKDEDISFDKGKIVDGVQYKFKDEDEKPSK
ncbi:YkvA family protein [Crassaminicella indica]|uniref:DUF1232 domain-containing protein n=1 Tax=Crassaminicella indica TaxID=2855394 RepID=A0ABX8R9Q5_9CLOT|nr:DUF1232 domain-containing protein [Crassaminicella indica]QXM05790.1 DUF1232 domain-containing protein [Crassaminicella indica]